MYGKAYLNKLEQDAIDKLHREFIRNPWMPSVHNAIASFLFDSAVYQEKIIPGELSAHRFLLEVPLKDGVPLQALIFISPIDENLLKFTYWLSPKHDSALELLDSFHEFKWNICREHGSEDRERCYQWQMRFKMVATVVMTRSEKAVILSSRARPVASSGPHDLAALSRRFFMHRPPVFCQYETSEQFPDAHIPEKFEG